MSKEEHPGRWPVHRADVPVINNLPMCDPAEVKWTRDYIVQLERERDELREENTGWRASYRKCVEAQEKLEQENAELRKRLAEMEGRDE